MWYGDPEPDTGTQDRLALLHGAQHLIEPPTGVIHQVTGQFGDDPGFIAGGKRDYNAVGGEQFGQEHGLARRDMKQS